MKLRNKLLLSCAALAACATTMVSTTFAWYTSNTIAKAGGVTAATQASGSDTLLASQTGNTGTWRSSITLTAEGSDVVSTNLVPLAWGSDGQGAGTENAALLHKANPDGTVAEAASTGYLHFSIYLKNPTSTKAINITKLDVKNTTSSTQTKPILAEAGLGGILSSATTTYAVDILRATNIMIYASTATGVANVDEGASFGTPTLKFALDTEKSHDYKVYNDSLDANTWDKMNSQDKAKSQNTYATGALNAHTYFHAVTGKEPTSTNVATKTLGSGSENIQFAALTAGDILKLDFCVFLNGADLHCFDACQGQTFSLDLEFSTEGTAVKCDTASAK